MPESQSHIRLVEALVSWVSKYILNGNDGLMFIDRSTSSAVEKPPKIGKYIPDVFVQNEYKYQFIIGEAKTANDLEKKHSISQIKEFILKCNENENSIFILAVPWFLVPLAKSISNEIVHNNNAVNVKVKILEKLSG